MVKTTDQTYQDHLSQVAQNTNQATGDSISINQFQPVLDQKVLNQDHSLEVEAAETSQETQKPQPEETELKDIYNGVVLARPRTAPAFDFLKEKMTWLSKKTGSKISLVPKKK